MGDKTTKDLGLMLLETLERLVCSPLFQKTGLGGESYMKLPDEDMSVMLNTSRRYLSRDVVALSEVSLECSYSLCGSF